MLVTFHSPATADVTMLSDLAQYLLGIVGKRIGKRGVISSKELPEAISKLEAAITAEAAVRADEKSADGFAVARAPACTVLPNRAYPFLDMMRAARQQQADILWGV
ncbi:hypothetical protein CF70_035010 [Cupriavidus sp. SK-3]|uniref:DUF1840 domain-containing protein n=1 Tax=Cupriavidus sp. SK-3 TaxID=1470558 RepID=UPI000446A74C|nr:DUF1840 domain-containing protein [Cupriavidus sp. SK-3]KDP87722.1 hypothetical protein CF70_035010 [Cupriavidus sp. SK-3]